MPDAMVTARMSQSKKNAGNEILQELGYSASQAINELYDRILETHAWPLAPSKKEAVDPSDLAEALAFVDGIARVPSSKFVDMDSEEAKRRRLIEKGARKQGGLRMNLLLDADIIVDVLRKRDFDYDESRLLLALGRLHEFELWISPSQLSDLFYILTSGGKKRLAEPVAEELSVVLSFVRVCTLGHEEATAALCGDFEDLEDALVYQAARSVRAEAIITRNQADFESSPIPALSSSEFFQRLAKERRLNYTEIAL